MLIFKLALAVLVMAATVSAGDGPITTKKKAVAIIYGEVDADSYGGNNYGAPAPAYGGSYPSKPYGSGYPAPPPAPAYGGSYPSKPYGGSYPSKPYGGSYPSKSYGGSYPAPPPPSYSGSYPSSSSYSSGSYSSRPLSYSKPGYGYGAPNYGAGPSYGSAPAYRAKQIITGKVEFSFSSYGKIMAKYSLKVSPSGYGGHGSAYSNGYSNGYGNGYDSGYSKTRSIVINQYGLEEDLRGNAYGSGYGSSYAPPSPYSYGAYSNKVEDICSETGNTLWGIESSAEEEYYGKISGNVQVEGCNTIEDIVGRSVVVYKKEGDRSDSSGAEPIACGTIALTYEDQFIIPPP